MPWKDINRAVEFNPEYDKAHCKRGQILFALKDFDKARACFAKASVVTPAALLLRQQLQNLDSSPSSAYMIHFLLSIDHKHEPPCFAPRSQKLAYTGCAPGYGTATR